MNVRRRILLLASLLLLVSVGGIGNIIWQLPHLEQMQDQKTVLRCLILLGLFGAGLIFSVLELVRHEIMSPIFQLAAQIIRLKEWKTGDYRLELTGSKDIDQLTRALNDMLAKRTEMEHELEKKLAVISRLKEIVNKSGCMAFVWRIEQGKWPVEFVSENVADILGYTDDDFISGRVSWPGITHPDDVPMLEKEVAGYLEQGARKWLQEYRLITKSGEIKWFCDENLVVADAAGKPEKIQAIVHDITARKQAEEALQESESKFRQLTESLPQLVWSCLPDGPCDYLSRQWIEYTGIPETEQIGYGWLQQLHPDDRERVMTEWKAAVVTGAFFDIEFRIRGKDGTYRWFKTRAMPIRDAQGKLLKWYGSNTDIQHLKQTEQNLKERVKELNCLHGISILMGRHDISLDEILQGVVELMPSAWQYSDIIGARIVLQDQKFQTANFQKTAWMRTHDIVVHGKSAGCVEVCYLKPVPTDGPTFLEEEDRLLDIVAEQLGKIIQRRKMEERLEKVNQCLLNLGADFNANIASITAQCGELLGGTCALYNRLDGGLLCAQGQWHTPPDFKLEDHPDGYICYDVIRGEENLLFVPNLPATRYAETDPNVRKYGLRSYLGHKVRRDHETIGSLCVVFSHPFEPTEDDRRLFGIMASALNVEENRHVANLALQASQKKYQDLVETLRDWVWEVDAQGRYTYVSPRVRDILGYEPKELIGKTPFELMPQDEAQRVAKIFESIAREQKPITIQENINLHKNGQPVVLETSGLPFYDAAGNYKGYRGADRDITARVEAEQKTLMLLRAIDTAHHGCLIMADDFHVVFSNEYALDKLGFNYDNMAEISWFSFCGDNKLAREVIEMLRITGRWMGEITVAKKDGQKFPALTSITVLNIAGLPNTGGFVLLFQDISVHKELRARLQASEKLAVMGRLVANVSHELNNPLAIIIGGTQLILGRLDEKQVQFKDQLESILRNARRCKTIMGNLLGYGRTVGKKTEAVNMAALIREAVDDVGYQHDMSAIDVIINYNEFTNVEIAGNRAALLSVFINIIRNARQAMGLRGVLTITMEKQEKGWLRIEIHDTGIGMNSEQRSKLFKPFVSGWKDSEGSGLGLAISLGIVEMHGGHMSAASEGEGKGTTFTIILPYKPKNEESLDE